MPSQETTKAHICNTISLVSYNKVDYYYTYLHTHQIHIAFHYTNDDLGILFLSALVGARFFHLLLRSITEGFRRSK